MIRSYSILKTQNNSGTKGTVLTRHLIQSFLPEETSPKMAHQIGMELYKKILKHEYEFVLSTHIDKGHIHNHIIFNNVNMVTGKCYQSNKKSYYKIRYQNDKLYKENNISVIDIILITAVFSILIFIRKKFLITISTDALISCLFIMVHSFYSLLTV